MKYINEAPRLSSKLTAKNGPFTLVAIKGSKVVGQIRDIAHGEIGDAIVYMKETNPGAKISVENSNGRVIHTESVNKSVKMAELDLEIEKLKKKKEFEKERESRRKKAELKEGDDDRCWDGYKPTPGKKAYEKGSCQKERESRRKKATSESATQYYYIAGTMGMKSNGSFTKNKESWITFDQNDVDRITSKGGKPYGATKTGRFIKTFKY